MPRHPSGAIPDRAIDGDGRPTRDDLDHVPPPADWDGQMQFLAQNGFRAGAHDRRGLGGGWFALSPGGTQVAADPVTDAGAMAVGAGRRRATRATA